ncbi:hypothetical protein FQZ97_1050220 [compost metagenome]
MSEFGAKRISRYGVKGNSSLGRRRTFGPDSLGDGFPNSIAMDYWGNLWINMLFSNRVAVITKSGELTNVLDFYCSRASHEIETLYSDNKLSFDLASDLYRKISPWITSLSISHNNPEVVYLGTRASSTAIRLELPNETICSMAGSNSE